MNTHWNELLAAERRARALLQRHGAEPGDVWEIESADDDDGLALLAAVRLAARRGAEVRLALAAPDTASQARLALVENCRRMDIPLRGSATASAWKRIAGGQTMSGDIPDADAVWSLPLDAAAPWVKPVDSACVPLTCTQCREIDARATGGFAVPGVCLMENAAMGAVIAAMDILPPPRCSRVAIVAGGGNNGGDGLAMARGFAALGIAVEVALLKPPEAFAGDAAINLALLNGSGIPVHLLHDGAEGLGALLRGKDLVVDGLLGTGFKVGLSPQYRTAIGAVNACGSPVLALDLPSGLDGDTGTVAEDAVRAARTVTFAAVKHGLLAEGAAEYVGELYLADIGAPDQAFLPQ